MEGQWIGKRGWLVRLSSTSFPSCSSFPLLLNVIIIIISIFETRNP